MPELNQYGQKFVEDSLARYDRNEDQIYSNIGAYDPEAVAEFRKIYEEKLVGIAIEFQNQVEFCWRHGKIDI